MPWLHRYVGNPVLTGILNLFFRTGVQDAHCGMRALRRDVLPRLDLRTTGMEFASEMVIRAAKEELDDRAVPDRVPPARRASRSSRASATAGATCASCSSTAPRYLFIIPGAVMAVLGTLIALTVLLQIDVLGREWDLHTMVGGALLMIVGTQVLALGLCAHAYGTYFMGEKDPWFDRMRARFRLEHGLLLGGVAHPGRPRARRGHRRHLDRPRLRRALRGAAGGARGDAPDRRDPDLLLVLPPEHPRFAPAALNARQGRYRSRPLALVAPDSCSSAAPAGRGRAAGSNYVPEFGPVAQLAGRRRTASTAVVLRLTRARPNSLGDLRAADADDRRAVTGRRRRAGHRAAASRPATRGPRDRCP